MPPVVPFTSAAKKHRERIMNLSFVPGAATSLLTSGANTQIKAYPYLRSLLLHVYCTGGTIGSAALNADAPYNALAAVLVTDTNGSGIYGGQTFTGFDAFLAHQFSGRSDVNDIRLDPSFSTGAITFEYILRIPFEYNARTGAGSLPNMSANATYGLTLIGNTQAAIYSVNPTAAPTVNVDVWMECWTLPDAQDLLGRNQMQGPPLLGTTQYTTKQQFTGLTASGSNTVALTRKGNMLRKWLFVTRNSSAARIASYGAAGTGPGGGALPNPFEFWWDGNRLTSDDPQILAKYAVEQNAGLLQSASVVNLPTGVIPYDWSAPYEIDYGGDGEGGWLATTQSSRLELTGGTWGSSASQLDVVTVDVAPIALANQYALDSASGKLMYPAQPEVR